MKSLSIAVAGFVLALTAAVSAESRARAPEFVPVLARGEAVLTDGKATIALPADFLSEAKAEGLSVLLTCKGGFSTLSATAATGGSFTVSTNEEGDPAQAFYWLVVGDRK